METEFEHDSGKVEVPQMPLAEFLATIPPGKLVLVNERFAGNSDWFSIQYELPDTTLHCSHDACKGLRAFEPKIDKVKAVQFDPRCKIGGNVGLILTYCCRNCRESFKSFAIMYDPTTNFSGMPMRKVGEWPPFGPPTPSRVISLIGPDKANFEKGRRCESQGLGIGAFAYYRRVVENQKNRLLSDIIKVAQRTGASPDAIKTMEDAKKETQFSKAMDMVKTAVPDSLKIGDHNPLTLLHTALSDGLHDQSEDHCLELAAAIRTVLSDLAERLGSALKDERELQSAVSKLLNVRSK